MECALLHYALDDFITTRKYYAHRKIHKVWLLLDENETVI